MYYYMTEKRIIHFDSIYSNKIDSNPFNTTFSLSRTLNRVCRISLKSIELPISNCNIRSPYSNVSIKYNNAFFNYTLPNKVYNDITLFLADLNTIISGLQTSMSSTEICPVFSLSTTHLNKLVIKTTLLSTSSLFVYSTGLISYYLGGINLLPDTKTLVSGSLYLNTYNLINVYNLCFDTYYNMVISNLDNPTYNNNNYPCHFKLITNSSNNSVYFSAESNSFIQDIQLNNKCLTQLNIIITDRYNNLIVNQLDFSSSLAFELN